MDVARLVLDYLALLVSWPVVVLVLVLVFIRTFREPLSDFLRRIVRGQAYGLRIEATTPAQQTREAEQPRSVPDESQVERYISENPKQVLYAYQRVLNYYLFERIYNVIYGTQIELLEHLEALGDSGDKYVNLVPFFNQFALASGLKNTQFSDYIGFLLTSNFVALSGEANELTAKITPRGIEFLTYIRNQYPREYRLRNF